MAYQQLKEKQDDSQALLQALSERQENTSDHALIAEQSRIEDALVRITKKKADLTHDISDIKENKDLIKQKTDQLSQALSQRRLEEEICSMRRNLSRPINLV